MSKGRANSFKQKQPKNSWAMFDKFMDRPIAEPVDKVIEVGEDDE
jgi:hypothetical protein